MTKLLWHFANWILALSIGFAALTTNVAQAAGDADKVKLIEAEAAGWSQNMEQLMSVYADDVTYVDTPLGSTFRGKGELRAFAQGFFNAFPDLKAVITSTVVAGDRAASEWRFTGTQVGDLAGMPASNKQMDLRGVSIYEFEGGKIKRKIDYWDMATLVKQLSR